jgi:hypothetical protein
MSVQYGWCLKIAEEAKSSERWPALALSFTTGKGLAKRNGDWIALRKEDFLELLETADVSNRK